MKKIVVLLFVLSAVCYSQSEMAELTYPQKFGLLPAGIKSDAPASLDFSDKTPKLENPLDIEVNYYLLSGIGIATGTAVLAVRNYYANTWWRENAREFRFANDWDYALWIDKYGHFYGTYLLAHAFSIGLEGANVRGDLAAIYGSTAALLFQLYVEYEDGYGPKWGFSPGDAVSDVLGAGYSVAQYYFPYLKNFQPRLSYWPTKELINGEKEDHNIMDDYEGQKMWLGFRMKRLLPDKLAQYWPSFMMLSVGMGVSDLDGSGGGNRDIYIALDLDAEELPLHGNFWQVVKNTLNYLHFPMPGVRINRGGAFFAICY